MDLEDLLQGIASAGSGADDGGDGDGRDDALDRLLQARGGARPGKPSLCFMGAQEAERAVDGPQGRSGGGAYFRAVADYVTDPASNVYGTGDEFFNLATSFLQAGDYYGCFKICRRALGLYPYDPDLIAEALRAASGCGMFDACRKLVEVADRLPRKVWNWRLFVFTIDYYQAYLTACDPSQIDTVLESALEVAREYQRCLPEDERGYNKEAELLIAVHRTREAREVLERAIFGEVDLGDGTRGSLVAPQCCVTMLDDVLGKSTDHALIAKVARRGVLSTAQAQPSASIGYFMYREALALDAIACENDFANAAQVRDAMTAYRCAYGMLSDRPGYRATIERRYSVLSHLGGVPDMPLDED